MPDKETHRAVAYARTASRRRADQAAIGRQLHACRQVAAELDATLEREFVDHGISGLTLNRVGLRQLLVYVADNPVDYVICADGTRLTRDYEHFKCLMQQLTAHDVRVVLADTDASYDAMSGCPWW
jgi:DNA invertase Pin-like site-specific DNA recombinase